MITIFKGESCKISIKIKNQQTSDYIDFTTLYNVILYLTDTQRVLAKFSILPKTGYITISLIDNYTLSLIIESSFTKNLKLNSVELEILEQISDADFINDISSTIAKYQLLSLKENFIKTDS
jgi:ethanolamine transporter EutH